ncbi:SDR family NAD(P)-dependent oxidoreductase [Frigoribacterium faeni]|uniref:SDR family NAD(P)-dependent oxidoreductase n=1 Tax=Frigoribacterium faeni TaxID=145483 RepID=UPI00141AE3F5|nr:SDR family NAD(P)-dependent oxidoreductase [Frigoribacterium faeni]NIJ04651.1 NAD(P)-dependent dehydrogenase (short-subunit alcohol dehydrogenase family) [Frigoribacterium faeni]
MAHLLVTGSSDGLGHGSSAALLDQGHDVVVHVRGEQRREAVAELVERGAGLLVADFGVRDDVLRAARELNEGRALDAVVHNAGVYSGAPLIPVNVVAPYLLTALLEHPTRHVYLSSGMHRSGTASLDSIDWTGDRATGTYADSKLLVTALSAAVARRSPGLFTASVDPGWVATKMGGPSAPDDFELGHRTQDRLAVGEGPESDVSGAHWHHDRRQQPEAAALDEAFQDDLLAALEQATGVALPER